MGLIERWDELVTDLGLAPGSMATTRDELLAAYGQPHRRYHAVEHLEAVLEVLDELCEPERPAVAARAAAWFHDAVYDPRGDDNEAASAQLARQRLGHAGVDASVVDDVADLVLATVAHQPPAGVAGAAELLDADLAVLGRPPETYAAYVAGVRAEYGHLDEASFRTGRAAVMAALGGRPRLFHSTRGAARFEVAARANLARELHDLGRAGVGSAGGAAPSWPTPPEPTPPEPTAS